MPPFVLIPICVGLLAVDEKQLSPSRIVLVVGEGGMFSVKSVHLKRAESDPALDWVSKMHKMVVEDVTHIQFNPLYNNSCSSKFDCPNLHWSCPYILASLFGGSSLARWTNQHEYLITPGIFIGM